MKPTVVVIVAVIIMVIILGWLKRPVSVLPYTNMTPMNHPKERVMNLTSSAFGNQQSIPSQYTCDGSHAQPPFTISDIPVDAVTLALIMEDPDVPKSIRADGMWDHWVVWNIPPTTTEIHEGQGIPGAVTGSNSSGKAEYQGPCPPDREHRYFFRLHALDTVLTLKPGSTKAELLAAMEGHVIATAELVGLYKRH